MRSAETFSHRACGNITYYKFEFYDLPFAAAELVAVAEPSDEMRVKALFLEHTVDYSRYFIVQNTLVGYLCPLYTVVCQGVVFVVYDDKIGVVGTENLFRFSRIE